MSGKTLSFFVQLNNKIIFNIAHKRGITGNQEICYVKLIMYLIIVA